MSHLIYATFLISSTPSDSALVVGVAVNDSRAFCKWQSGVKKKKRQIGEIRRKTRRKTVRRRLRFGTWHAYLKHKSGPRAGGGYPACQVTWPCVKGLRFSSPDFSWRGLTDRLAKSDWYSSATGFALIMRYYSVIAPLWARAGLMPF